jgi:AcrR family transcriptional regulator
MAPDERRAALIAAALPLLAERGTAVSTREIAEAAGVAEGTIFRVFADKSALVDAALVTAFDPAPLKARIDAIDPDESFESIVWQALVAFRERLEGVWKLLWAMGMQAPPPQVHILPTSPGSDAAGVERRLAMLLEQHRDRLSVEPGEAVEFLRLVVFACAHPRITQGRPLSTERIFRHLLFGITNPPDLGELAIDLVAADIARDLQPRAGHLPGR